MIQSLSWETGGTKPRWAMEGMAECRRLHKHPQKFMGTVTRFESETKRMPLDCGRTMKAELAEAQGNPGSMSQVSCSCGCCLLLWGIVIHHLCPCCSLCMNNICSFMFPIHLIYMTILLFFCYHWVANNSNRSTNLLRAKKGAVQR